MKPSSFVRIASLVAACVLAAPGPAAARHEPPQRFDFSHSVSCTSACPHKPLQVLDEVPGLEPLWRLHGELACAPTPLAPPLSYDQADGGSHPDGAGWAMINLARVSLPDVDVYACGPDGEYRARIRKNDVDFYVGTFPVAAGEQIRVRVFNTHLALSSIAYLLWCHDPHCRTLS